MIKITPVLLAGGVGTRLWPLSRSSYPKQFSKVFSDKSLFQQSVLRLTSSAEIKFGPQMTITNSDFRFIVTEQYQDIGIDPGLVVIEPSSRNTAPAILAASLISFKQDEEAVLLVAPSDHIIPDTEAFHKAVQIGLEQLQVGKMVTFGVSPTRPETGYGYLELIDVTTKDASEIVKFVEKPDLHTAEEMLHAGNFLWNAGIFLFRAKDMIDAFHKNSPNLIRSVSSAVDKGSPDLSFFRLDVDSWDTCEDVSIDYAIMEKTDNLVAVLFAAKWSDLGGWEQVWKEMEPNLDGVSISENAHAIECKNTLLRSETANQQLVGLGLENIIVVAMPDAVLVAHKDKAQDVRKAVERLKAEKIQQATSFSKDHRPWGWFEVLAVSERFQVKRIHVNPGAALSLQSHHHRSEHWIVVEGTAKVTVDDMVKLVSEGESVYIPLGAIHRMENPGKLPMILVEVQTGAYLGEDDIVRYEDLYSRI